MCKANNLSETRFDLLHSESRYLSNLSISTPTNSNCKTVIVATPHLDLYDVEGYSVPRNKELMRIYKDVELVEQLGSGVPRIIETYDRSC